MKILKKYIAIFGAAMSVSNVLAELPLNYDASITGIAGSGTFAPYYISSLKHGRFSQSKVIQPEVAIWKSLSDTGRFSYGFGVDVVGGYSSSTDYERYSTIDKNWYYHSERPSAIWLQQLYGEIRYRSFFVELGLKERGSSFLMQSLTSGDLIESGNARPIPQIRIGLIDFRDIPLTNGWLQISSELAYGAFLDNGWWKDHYNYYNYHIAKDELYNYKRLYFRTKPSCPFSVTVGMQAVAIFGGSTSLYSDGEIFRVDKHSRSLKTFIKMLIPTQDGGEGFYTGNHIGSWDIRGRYRLTNGSEISVYTSWLWEDGSGIGKLNGWDGLWGLEYKSHSQGLVRGALIEYLDFTNQSGPIHYAPGDYNGTDLLDHASGADDYYNNAAYNSYAYFGQSIGTPAMLAPIYNTNGYMGYVANSMRGFHVGIEGTLTSEIDYRIKGGYRKAWGTPKMMLREPVHLSAVMLEASWRPEKISGLCVNASLEFDRGNMPNNAFGAMVGVRYTGMFNIGK